MGSGDDHRAAWTLRCGYRAPVKVGPLGFRDRRSRNACRQASLVPRAPTPGRMLCAGVAVCDVLVPAEINTMTSAFFSQLTTLGSSVVLLFGIVLLCRRSFHAYVEVFRWQSLVLSALVIVVEIGRASC